jgi:hypothetical protein
LREDCERNIQRLQTCFRCNNKVAGLSLSHEASRSYSLLYGEFVSRIDRRQAGIMTSKRMINTWKRQSRISDMSDDMNVSDDMLKNY